MSVAGIFTVFEQLMYVNIKVNEQKILDSLERQQRKQNFLTAALQLMEVRNTTNWFCFRVLGTLVLSAGDTRAAAAVGFTSN